MTDADRLTDALRTIRDEWDNALEPLPTPSAGKNANKQASKPPIGVEALSIRTEVWEFLASWTRYTIGWWDDLERISAHAPALAARLLTHVEDLAQDETILDELHQLESLAKQLDRAANPPAPLTDLTLGPSPTDPFGRLIPTLDRPGHLTCTTTNETHPVWHWWALQQGHDPCETVDRATLLARTGITDNNLRQRTHHGQITEKDGTYLLWQVAYGQKNGWPKKKRRSDAA